MEAGLPPVWAVIMAIMALLFGGTGGVVWSLRKEAREAKAAPALSQRMKLENEQAAQEIAQMLRDAQSEAIKEMRVLLTDARGEASLARKEVATLRGQMTAMQKDHVKFRERVEAFLTSRGIDVPEWWHES